MYHTVIELRKLGLVPTVGSTYQITCDTLQSIHILAAALRTNIHMLLCILVSAVHTAVACMVHTSVADVVLIHQVNDVHHHLGVMCGIAVNLHIEDMAASGQIVIGSLYLSLVQGRAMVVDRHVVRVGVVVAVCDTW